MRHEPEDLFGEIAVQTVRRGRPAEVRARLRAAQIADAHNWARDRRTVIVEGKVRRLAGRPLLVQNPISVQPIDETYLLTE